MQAVAWMLGTLLSFSFMAICARELSGEIATQQTLFFRSTIGLVCVSIVLFTTKNSVGFRSNKIGLHVLRNIFHFAGQYGWFLGIGLLPLAEVFALEFTVPIWTLAIASITLGEKISARKLISIILGILGVFVILQPGVSIIDSASFIVLGAAICYAVSHTATKSLSSSEPALSVLWHMCLIQLPFGFFLSLPSWVWPVGAQWYFLLVIGLTALSAHYCMVKAMQHAEATTVVTLDFLRLPLITLVGVALYSEAMEVTLLLGGLLMLAGNIVSLKRPVYNKPT